MNWFTTAAAAVSSHLGRNAPLVKRWRPTYDQALDFLYARSGMEVHVGEETLRVCPRVRNFAQIESDVYAYLHAHIRPGDTVFDVGSFLGIYAMVSARRTGPRGLVVSFEPTTTSLPFLHRHLVMNGMQTRVRVLACAVGRRSGTVEFFEHGDAYLNSVGVQDPSAAVGDTVQVPMLSIDEACALFGWKPDVIRVDVQGLEAEVLQGAKLTIAKHPELKIIIEIHPQLWALHALDEAKFKAQLHDLGLDACAPDGGPPAYFPDAHLVLRPIGRSAAS